MKPKARDHRAKEAKHSPFDRLLGTNRRSEFPAPPEASREIGTHIGDFRHNEEIGNPTSPILAAHEIKDPQDHPHLNGNIEESKRRDGDVDHSAIFFAKMECK